MGEVAELLQNLVQLYAHRVESHSELWIRDFAGQANFDAEGGQMLLRTVMEVALDLAALSLARGQRRVRALRELVVR